jgi:hypothetical protein
VAGMAAVANKVATARAMRLSNRPA